MPTSTTFLGLGAMGSALAAVAVDAGRPVVVWNRTAARTRTFAQRGATVAGDVEQAISDAQVIVVCLFDHQSVHDVLDPVATGLQGRAVINLTTTTPDESRELAAWAAERDITYLDGAIMAVPQMIGSPGSTILYSGSAAAFDRYQALLDLWGDSSFCGPDAGMASLYDMAMLVGMYTMLAGFLHGAAMVGTAAVPATEFAKRQAPFLSAMAGLLSNFAGTVDSKDYTGEGQQSLLFTETALATLLRASIEHGINTEILEPVHEIVRRQIAAGFGRHSTARIYEGLQNRSS